MQWARPGDWRESWRWDSTAGLAARAARDTRRTSKVMGASRERARVMGNMGFEDRAREEGKPWAEASWRKAVVEALKKRQNN